MEGVSGAEDGTLLVVVDDDDDDDVEGLLRPSAVSFNAKVIVLVLVLYFTSV